MMIAIQLLARTELRFEQGQGKSFRCPKILKDGDLILNYIFQILSIPLPQNTAQKP
jgi:hypothetical protein